MSAGIAAADLGLALQQHGRLTSDLLERQADGALPLLRTTESTTLQPRTLGERGDPVPGVTLNATHSVDLPAPRGSSTTSTTNATEVLRQLGEPAHVQTTGLFDQPFDVRAFADRSTNSSHIRGSGPAVPPEATQGDHPPSAYALTTVTSTNPFAPTSHVANVSPPAIATQTVSDPSTASTSDKTITSNVHRDGLEGDEQREDIISPPLPTDDEPVSRVEPRATQTRSLGFDRGLVGWTVNEFGGSGEHAGTVIVGSAVLHEGNSFLVTLDRGFEIPRDPISLDFTYQASFDTTDDGHMRDAFEASLTGPDGELLVYAFEDHRDAFFNLTEGLPAVTGRGTSVETVAEGTRVTVDLANVFANQQATLQFRLVNNDQDEDTTVRILEVNLTAAAQDEQPEVTVELQEDTAPQGPDTARFRRDLLTNNPALQGTAADDHGITLLEVRIDEGEVVDITSRLTDGSYDYDPGTLAPGPHRATVRATDTIGQVSEAILDFRINHPPVADADGNRSADEGQSLAFDGSNSSDKEADIYSYGWTFPGGTNADGTTATSHFSQDGTYPVSLTVVDTAGSTVTDTIEVSVNNLAPTVEPLADADASQFAPVLYLQSFDDPGRLDRHTGEVAWGDGNVSPATVWKNDSGGQFVLASHAYQLPGTYNTQLEVHDDGNASATTQATAEISGRFSDANPRIRQDTSDDGVVTPRDVLFIFNELNARGPRAVTAADLGPPYLDVNDDLLYAPVDALWIINLLNRQEGEPPRTKTPPVVTGGLIADTAARGALNRDTVTREPAAAVAAAGVHAVDRVEVTLANRQVDLPGPMADGTTYLVDEQVLTELFEGPINDGEHDLMVQAVDVAGNVSQPLAVLFTLDRTAPELLELSLEGQAGGDLTTRSGTVTLEGMTEKLAQVHLDSPDRTVTADAAGGFRIPDVPLTVGTNDLHLTITDPAGNASEFLHVVTRVDEGLPQIQVALVNDTGTSASDRLTSDPALQGQVTDDGEVVRLAGGLDDLPEADFREISFDSATGDFRITDAQLKQLAGTTLADGVHTLKLVAEDRSGNRASVAFSFELDTTSPVAALAAENALATALQTLDIAYSEPVTAASFLPNSYRLRTTTEGSGREIGIQSLLQLADDRVRLHLAEQLRSLDYALEITAAINDLAGNALALPLAIPFTVTDPVGLVSISPYHGEEMVSVARKVVVRFEDEIDTSTVTNDSFYLIANGEPIEGNVRVSSTRRFATFMPESPLPPATEMRVVVDGDLIRTISGQRVDADGDGKHGGQGTADFSTLPLTRIAGTNLFGFVYDSMRRNTDGTNVPLVGATIRVDAFPAANAVTDENGRFELVDMPAPEFFVHIDGSTTTHLKIDGQLVGVNHDEMTYPSVGKPFHSVPGQTVQISKPSSPEHPQGMPFDIFLPSMVTADVQHLLPESATDIGFGPGGKSVLVDMFPEVDPAVWDRLAVTFPAGSAIDDEGNPAAQAVIVPVPPDRIPAPLPPFLDPQLVISIQAGGATSFDIPAPVTFPNLEGLAPGTRTLLFSFNHTAGRWEPSGAASVSADGLTIVSDPGTGVVAPGWHAVQQGAVVRGGLVLGQRGSLFGRSATDELSLQTGRHYYSLENLENGFIVRGVTDVVDRLFNQQILAATTDYRLSVFGLTTGQYGTLEFRTPGNGGTITAPEAILKQQTLVDTDVDGLPDVVEDILGTAADRADTDDDGIGDRAELLQGLNPFDDRPFPTGIIAALPLRGSANDLVIQGSVFDSRGQMAYVATTTGLAVVDVTQFDNPLVLGQLDLGNATDVAVDQRLQIAAVTTGPDGLHLVDVSDPMMPDLLRTIEVHAGLVEVFEGVAYVTVDRAMRTFDVLTGDDLVRTSQLVGGSFTGLARERAFLYAMDDAGLLQVLDISTGTVQPRGQLVVGASRGRVYAADGIVYALNPRDRGGYSTIDVEDPDAPTLISGPDVPNFVFAPGGDFAGNGSGLGLVVGGGNVPTVLDVLDVSDPNETNVFLTRIPLPQLPNSVNIASGVAYVADSSGGLVVVNYVGFDRGRQAPQVTVTAADDDPNEPGLQVQEGTSFTVDVDIADDVQVRNVELFLDGQLIANDVSFPFEFQAVAPLLAAGVPTTVVQVRATDTGGNVTLSSPLEVELVPDTFAPSIVSVSPEDGSLRPDGFRTIRVAFSEEMNEATLVAENFRLEGPDSVPVDIVSRPTMEGFAPIDVQVRRNGREVQFTYAQLPAGDYELTIDTHVVSDRAGNPIGGTGFQSTFSILEVDAAWVGGSGQWGDAENWDTGAVPGVGDDVLIAVPGDVVVEVRDDVTVNRLTTTESLKLIRNKVTVSEEFVAYETVSLDGATLKDTRVSGRANAEVVVVSNSTLDSVSLDIDLDLRSRQAEVVNGLTLNGTAEVGSHTAGNRHVPNLLFSDADQTLDGTGEIVLIRTGAATVQIDDDLTLTIGSDITVRGAGGFSNGTGNIVNLGTIRADDAAGQWLELQGPLENRGRLEAINGATLATPRHAWTSSGVIRARGAGSTVKLYHSARITGQVELPEGGTFEINGGTLINTDNTLEIDPDGVFIAYTGTIVGGTLSGPEGSEVILNNRTVLDGVTVDTDIRGNVIEIVNGLTLNGTADVGPGVGPRAGWLFRGEDQTLDGAGRVVLGDGRGRIAIDDDLTLTIGADITVSGTGAFARAQAHAEGHIVNHGTIRADVAGNSVDVGVALTNQGRLEVLGGESLNVSELTPHAGTIFVGAGGQVRINSDFVQEAGGVISVDIASTSKFGSIAITDSVVRDATFAGTLNANLVEDFEPALGNSFPVVTYFSQTGTFDTINGLDLPNGLVFEPNYGPTAFTLTAGMPLRSAGPPRNADHRSPRLSIDALEPLIREAIARWAVAATLEPIDVKNLSETRFRIEDLADSKLAFASPGVIWIDDDAAGHGWFVDATPADDVEFEERFDGHAMEAATDEARRDVDLLTVIAHELGHLLGYVDLRDEPHDVMSATLTTGVRRMPTHYQSHQHGNPAFGAANADDPQPDSRGTEFWLAFPGSIGLVGDEAELSLRVSSELPASGQVDVPGLGFSVPFTVTPGQVTTVILPRDADLSFSSDQVTAKGIHVTADREISVYGVSRAAETTDAFLGLPVDILGTDYIALGYKNLDKTPNVFETFPGTEFGLVATQDATNVTITPSVTTGARAAGVPYLLTLDRGETYLLQNTGLEANDLSGSRITADKPIAVFGGHAAANIPTPAIAFADYLVEQLLPVSTWGSEFITVPLASRPAGDTFRIVASVDDTTVTIDGQDVATLDRGEVQEMILTEASHITADQPVLVAQYANSANFDDSTADPFMMLVPAVDQFLGAYTVTTDVAGLEAHFVNLAVPDAAVGAVLHNGVPVTADQFQPVDGSGFSFARLTVPPGSHTLTGPLAFGASVYGFGVDESYGYPAGLAVTPAEVLTVSGITIAPKIATNAIGDTHTVTATVVDQNDQPLEGVAVEFVVSGANRAGGFERTDAAGMAVFEYEGVHLGTDSITASSRFVSDTAQAEWTADPVAIEVTHPPDDSTHDAGTTLLVTGQVDVDPAAQVAAVTVNGTAVQSVDRTGRFFTQVTVAPGLNEYEFEATDTLGQTRSTRLTITGVQPDEPGNDVEMFNTNVSASFGEEYGRTSYVDKASVLYADLAIRNTGQFASRGPFFVAIDHISDPSVQVARPDGTTPDGLPYYEFTDLVAGAVLAPGEASGSRAIAFFNPQEIPFTFDTVIYGQLNEPPAITSVPAIETLAERPYRYSVEATDPDNDPLAFELLSGPAAMTLDASTGLLAWTPAAQDVGAHSVLLRVHDGQGGTAQQSFDLTAIESPGNRPPVFLSPPVVDASVNTAYLYEPEVTYADRDQLSFSLIRAPQGMTVAADTGRIDWTPTGDHFGAHAVQLVADDGQGGRATQAFAIAVGIEPGNRAPVIISDPVTTALAPGEYTYDAHAIDADLDPLRYSLVQAPPGMTIDPATGLVQWQVAEITVLDFESLAHDGNEFVAIDRLVGGEVTHYEEQGYAIDALNPNFLGLGAYGSGSNEYSGSPALANRTIGGVTRLTALDGSAFDLVSMDLAEAGFTGSAPVTVTFVGTLAAGGTVTQTFTTDGGDFSPQTFVFAGFDDVTAVEWTQASPFHQFDNLVISSTANITQGRHAVTIRADDGRGGIATQGFTLRVLTEPLNNPPQITSEPPLKARVQQSYGTFVVADDPDGDPLRFALTASPSGMTIDDQAGLIRWTPTDSQLGSHDVTVVVTDGVGGSDTQSFAVQVAEALPNNDPQVTSTPVFEAIAERSYEYLAIGADPDGDFLTYELLEAPDGMTIDPERGLITWTPRLDQEYTPVEDPRFNVLGSAHVKLQAADGRGGTAVQTFDIIVLEIDNLPPRIDSIPPDTAVFGGLYTYDASAIDLDGDTLTFEVLASTNVLPDGVENSQDVPAGLAIDPETGFIAWVPRYEEVGVRPGTPFGVQELLLRVSDRRGGYDVQILSVVVTAPPSPPVITSTVPRQVMAENPVTFHVHAQDANGDPLFYAFDGAPDGMLINETTGVVKWTPTTEQLGEQRGTIVVRDEGGAEARQEFTIEVVEQTANLIPRIDSVPPATVQLGRRYLYLIEASDPNGDALTFHLDLAPGEMTLNADSRSLSWQPTGEQLGPHRVQVRVTDGRGGAMVQRFTVTVLTENKNLPPDIISNPSNAATLGRTYAYDAVGVDPNGDTLVWELLAAPLGMSLDPLRATLRWTPTEDQVGKHDVRLRVLDGNGGSATQSFPITVRAVNLAPNITSVPHTRAAVDEPYAYAVRAEDPEGDPLHFTLTTAPEGMVINARAGLIEWRPAATQLGMHTVGIRVEDGQGGTATQSYELHVAKDAFNNRPSITSTPTFRTAPDALYAYQVVAVDADEDPLDYLLLEAPAGMAIDESGLVEWTPTSGQLGSHVVIIGVVDTAGAGASQRYSLLVTDNEPPLIVSEPVTQVETGELYQYDVRANDPNDDPLTYRLLKHPAGMTVDAFGRIQWPTAKVDVGQHVVQVQVADDGGLTDAQSFLVSVTADLEAPKLQLSLDPNPVEVGGQVVFTVSAVDNVGVESLTLIVDGKPVVLDAGGRATVLADRIGSFEVVARAADAAGNAAQGRTRMVVVEPDDEDAPVVEITSPADDVVVTEPIDIVGTASDDNLLFYVVEVAPVAGGAFQEMFRGTTSVTDGVLGTFDPSILASGTYRMRLRAEDASENVASVGQLITVAGDLKVGNFTLSFTDLSLPVSGIPVTVTRTYDSLNAGTSDELGHGWRLEFRDVDLATSLPPSGTEQVGYFTPFRDGTRVFATLPGGRREGFTFRINLARGFKGSILRIFEGHFVADPGSTSRLAVEPFDLRLNEYGEAFDYRSNLPYNPSSPFFGSRYVLSTEDGLAYEVNADTGDLDTVADTRNNQLLFQDTAIESSSGAKVLLERDPQGRIIAVQDPAGNRVRYAYDARGNLAKVIDREGVETRFLYEHPGRPHYLTGIVDPLGREGVRTEYDDQGRLVKLIDVEGNPVELIHDPENSVETVKDALGNTTAFVYDSRGNVVTEVDPAGGRTDRTYDRDNNMLTETVFDGTDPAGFTTTFTYDGDGNVLSEQDPLGNVTRFTYASLPASGAFARFARPITRLATTTDPLGNTTTNRYNASGDLISTTDALGHTTIFTYDDRGNQTSITASPNEVTRFEYDQQGNVTRQIDPLGHETSYTYDANGNQLTETLKLTTPGGERTLITTTEYDANGRPTRVTDAEGNVTVTEYDELGNQAATVDALRRRTEFRYDDRGQLVRTEFEDGTSTSIAYDELGRRTRSTDRGGRTTRFEYDAAGRQVATIFPDGTPAGDDDNPRTRTEYDLAGRVLAQIDERGHRTEFEYDAAGRQILVRDALENETKTAYDQAGRSIATTDALGRVTRFVHDALGRVTRTVFPDDTETLTEYDAQDRVVAQVDPSDQTTGFEYDRLGRLIAVIDALQQRTEYEYDEAGNLVVQRDANGHETKFEYDKVGRRIAHQLPLGQRSTTEYDKAGNVTQTTDFNGSVIDYEYDENYRLVTQQFDDDSEIAYTYTATGQRETVTDDRETTNYTYDERDRLKSRIDPDGAKIAYTYDEAGNRTSATTTVTDNDARVTRYTFDELNRLATVTDPEDAETSYGYNEVGSLVRTEFPNGIVETREYDQLNRLLTLAATDADELVISSFEYTLDPSGNRESVVEHNGRQVDYEYDELYRLVGETITDALGGDRTVTYVYDPVGNRLSRDDSVEGVTTYEYDENDRLLLERLAGDETRYRYDDNGNTLSRESASDKIFYEWDDENRLVAVDTDGDGTVDVEYAYDADGLRVSRTAGSEETRFLLDANRPFAQVVEEYTPGGVIKASFIHGSDLVSQNRTEDGGNSYAKTFYHVDGLGSVRALTDSSGNVTDRYLYDAFGRTIGQVGSTDNVYLFAGEQRDLATELDYLRARWMNTEVGRFYGMDPFEGSLLIPVSQRPYQYADLNPISNTDPSGLTTLTQISISAAIQGILRSVKAARFVPLVCKTFSVFPAYEALSFVSSAFSQLSFQFAFGGGLVPGFKLEIPVRREAAPIRKLSVSVDQQRVLSLGVTGGTGDLFGTREWSVSIRYDLYGAGSVLSRLDIAVGSDVLNLSKSGVAFRRELFKLTQCGLEAGRISAFVDPITPEFGLDASFLNKFDLKIPIISRHNSAFVLLPGILDFPLT